MKPIFLTEQDYQRLSQLVQVQQKAIGLQAVHALKKEVTRAWVVPSEEIPMDVITMNSRVRLKRRNGEAELEITVVYPKDADLVNRKVSVLAPTGTAMLGCKVGDEIKWPAAQGARAYKVEEILYQPEAAGHLDL